MFNRCSFYLTGFLIIYSSLVSAIETTNLEQKTMNSDQATITTVWYACPIDNQRVVYTTIPRDVHCQIAHYPPTDDQDIKNRQLSKQNSAGLEQLQRLWYDSEFINNYDIEVKTPLPKISVNLRQQSQPSSSRQKSSVKIPISMMITQPKRLTPKQLIQRDINSEQKALIIAQQKLHQAKKQKNEKQIKDWQENIDNRQATIQVLKRELRQYQN